MNIGLREHNNSLRAVPTEWPLNWQSRELKNYVANPIRARLLFALTSFPYEPSGLFHYPDLCLCRYRIGSTEAVL